MTCDRCGDLISILNAVQIGKDKWICEDCAEKREKKKEDTPHN